MNTRDDDIIEIKVIARIQTDFPSKFGIPRQSGLIDSLEGRIVFEPEYRNEAAVKGLESYSHLWLIWQFSEVADKDWSPTVRPPRLGGNTRIGVFATRSPFRPNHLGLSAVRLQRVEMDEKLGPVIYVRGADLMDNTPIVDIKPYIPYADSYPEASSGVFQEVEKIRLQVEIPPELLDRIPAENLEALKEVLAEDPRPSYQKDPERIYGLSFARLNIRFRVENDCLMVIDVENL